MKVNLGSSSKQRDPSVDRGIKVNYGMAKRVKYRWRWYLLLILFTAPIAFIAWSFIKPVVLVTGGGIITADPIEVRSPVAAKVHRIDVNRGDLSKGNTILVQLVNEELHTQIRELEQQLSLLPQTDKSYQQDILFQIDQQVDVAHTGLVEQLEFRDSYEGFRKTGVVSIHEMAAVLQTVTNSRLIYETAKTNRLQVEQEQTQQLAAGILIQRRQQLELQLAQLNAQRDLLAISLPQDSRVIDLLVKQGQFVQANEPLILMSHLDVLVIFGYLEPRHFEYAMVGQKATVRLPNGRRIRAEVSEPPQVAQSLPNSLVGPFDGNKPYLKVTLSAEEVLPISIEGLPVELIFDFRR